MMNICCYRNKVFLGQGQWQPIYYCDKIAHQLGHSVQEYGKRHGIIYNNSVIFKLQNKS